MSTNQAWRNFAEENDTGWQTVAEGSNYLSTDAMLITNRDGIIVQANRQVTAVFGWTPAELVGQPIEVLVPADLRAEHIRLREDYLKSASPRPMGNRPGSLVGLRKDDSSFSIEVSLSPMQTPEGLLVAAAVRDVTESQKVRKKLESTVTELREAKVFADTLIESVSGLFYVIDQDGEFVRWNESFLLRADHHPRGPGRSAGSNRASAVRHFRYRRGNSSRPTRSAV
ncbi:MAG TPA: PAS domain S-box protein [Pirellulaceae bacterium]|nr:PAS domain S-box protein [Pirellulaceae bacterium]